MRKAKNRKKKKEWTKIKYRHNPPKKSIGKVRDRISTGGVELEVFYTLSHLIFVPLSKVNITNLHFAEA